MDIKFLFLLSIISVSCSREEKLTTDFPYILEKIIYQELFNPADTSHWVVESEEKFTLKDHFLNGSLDIDVGQGITLWNTTKFQGNLMIEFEVTVIQAGGKNDRVSDLNCFWMATDPEFPDNFFAKSSWRKGIFWNYYPLHLYYVGYGGHDNTKTRLRKYNGVADPVPPVLQEHSDSSHLIKPNKKNVVRIVSFDSTVAYYFNKKKIFELKDKRPYKEGYFGFRTVYNHMSIESFTVYSLRSGN